jgi:hypothetical protein
MIARVADELIVLDESVIRVLGESERRELQGIDYGQLRKRQSGEQLREHRQIVPADVVPEDKVRSYCKGVETDSNFLRTELPLK